MTDLAKIPIMELDAIFRAATEEAATRNQKQRRYVIEGQMCVTCGQHMAHEMMPPHDASPRCESGKRNHCSCDVCF